VSVAAVRAVFAVAGVVGLRPSTGTAQAARVTVAPVSAPASAQPAAIVAPLAARQVVASRGDVAYRLAGDALTLDDIPPRALAAYERAAMVIDLADRSCRLDWQLLAALGKVLTDHGRVGGSQLDEHGVPRPWVLGQRLTGRHGTQRVPDTDSGRFDRDGRLDRAVGPMMLLPSVWSVVSVDGDSDGRRNPQDIDDATLAAAVLLCAGPGDLRNASVRYREIQRFHGGSDYAKDVLLVRAAYLDAEVPSTVSVLAREEGVAPVTAPGTEVDPTADQTYAGAPTFEPGPSPSSHPVPSSTPSPTGGPSPTVRPSPSGSPSPGQSPSSSPSSTDCPTATGEPSPTATPTATAPGCPLPTETPSPSDQPTPVEPSNGPGAALPTTALSVPVAPLLSVGTWLWWRRRRPSDEDATPTV
jgi:membrane-bound lytic murein transglycosylase B